MGKTAKIWLDVSLRNLVIMLAAATGMGVETRALLELIPRQCMKEIEKSSYFTWDELLIRHVKDMERFKALKSLVGHLTHLEKALCTAMVSLVDYNIIQDTFAAFLGHPWRLREAGQYAINKSFGFEAVEKLLLRTVLRWFTDPFIAISQVASGNNSFNHNKIAECFRAGLGRAFVFYRYRKGPDGMPERSTLEDRRSLLYWIRGILEKIAPLWPSLGNGWLGKFARMFYPWQRRVGEVHYKVIGMSVRDLIRAEYPGLEQNLHEGVFSLRYPGGNWEQYGEIVVLTRQEGGEFDGRYLGAWRIQEASDPSPLHGIRLTRDVLAPGRDGEDLPLALKDEIYARHAPETVIEMRWVTHPLLSPLFRALSAGPIAMQGLKLGIESEMRTTEAAAAAQSTTRQMASLLEEVAGAYPTREIADVIRSGIFPPEGITSACAVVVADIIGFTRAQVEAEARGEKEDFTRRVTDALNSCRGDAQLAGGWVKPTAGDQIIAFFPLTWGGYGRSAAEENDYGLPDVCRLAVETAVSFRKSFHEQGFNVRIASHVGDLTWNIVAGNFDANGSAISVAAHIESVALKKMLQKENEGGLLAISSDVVAQATLAENETCVSGLDGPHTVELKRGGKINIYLVP
jgi:class 3 adenylate cyclase